MATFGTFVDNVSLKAAELNSMFAAQAIVPTFRQGVTMTQLGPRMSYYVVNKFVFCEFVCVVGSGTGTAGTRIEVDFPLTATSSSMRIVGSGIFYDASSPSYRSCRIVRVSTTRMAFLTDSATSLTSYLGTTNGPAITLAISDQLRGCLMYEAA